jgi:hypothetical protein
MCALIQPLLWQKIRPKCGGCAHSHVDNSAFAHADDKASLQCCAEHVATADLSCRKHEDFGTRSRTADGTTHSLIGINHVSQ